MTKRVVLLSSLVVAGLMAATTAAPRADTIDKLTFLTFSGNVQVPGVKLDAGTYRFRLTNPNTDRNVIQVLSHDGSIVASLRVLQVNSTPGLSKPLGSRAFLIAAIATNSPELRVRGR